MRRVLLSQKRQQLLQRKQQNKTKTNKFRKTNHFTIVFLNAACDHDLISMACFFLKDERFKSFDFSPIHMPVSF